MKIVSRLILVVASMMLPNTLLSMVAFGKNQTDIGIVFFALAILGIIANAASIAELLQKSGEEMENVTQIKRFGFDSFSHILSYIPSLIAFSIDLSSAGTALVGFYLLYLLLLAASDMVVLNPFLHLLGWRFQSATLQFEAGSEEVVVIVAPNHQLKLGNQKLVPVALFGMYLLRE